MSVKVGDKVQIKHGAKDVTNGYKARKGYLYGEDGPSIATVESITSDWDTGGKFGLPKKVTKVRCSHKGVVVWQVQPQDIVVKITSDPPKKEEVKKPKSSGAVVTRQPLPKKEAISYKDPTVETINTSNNPYAITKGSNVWYTGITSTENDDIISSSRIALSETKQRTSNATIGHLSYQNNDTFKSLSREQIQRTGTNRIKIDSIIQKSKYSTAFQDQNTRQEMLNLKREIIQNQEGFPFFVGQKGANIPARYNYQIIIDDNKFNKSSKLSDKLRDIRAELGLPVHGNNQIAKSMKYYMYNRFRTPDINMAHNKSVTYVFFTRPDLNLLEKSSQGYTAVKMIENHTEASMTWRRHPELFKLLTDKNRCGDSDNFNLLLSNQVQTFEVLDEELSTASAGKSWNEHEITYGDSYTGRAAGTFSCEFVETSQYEIINLLKLWITYIDNVSRGAWSPSYRLYGLPMNTINASHVHSKTLDYASSVYVFKCGPDGEDVLYWSKYYGVFPLNTGASALSWNNTNPIGESPKLNIKFGYSFKRDMSPISLIEFNNISGVDTAVYEPSYNKNLNHNGRPYVGAPYIEMNLGSPQLESNDVSRVSKRTQIRLKFKKDNKASRSDNILYKSL